MLPELLSGLRIIFGLLFLLFVPGYALTLALFPRWKELDFIERIGFACVLSIVTVMLSTLFIDLVLHVPTTALNIIAALLTLTALALFIWRVEILVIRVVEKRKRSKREVGKEDAEK